VVAFGGRILDEGEPKYMNSPETPVYQKNRVLYGLNVAKGKIREAGSAVVVEGYTDLISAHMAGVSNTVATLGTALTRRHLRLLKRYTTKVVVVYDADSAGTEAAKRSLETFLEEDLMGQRAALPEGHDPDSLVREKGPEALTEALKGSIPLADFFIQETESCWRGEGIEGKTRAVAEVIPILARMKSRVQQSEYIRRVSQVMDVREEAVAAELKRYLRGSKRSPETATPARKAPRSRITGEEELIRAMLMDGELAARIKNEFPLVEFGDEASRAVAAAIYSLLDDGQEVDPALNLNLADPGAAALAARLLAEEDLAVQMEKKVNDCLLSFKQARLGEELREIQAKIRTAEAADNAEVINELLRIKQKIRQNMMSLQSASN
jgi:DNA primase